MSQWVLHEVDQPGVALVTLNRPDRRNALSIALMSELVGLLEQLETDQRWWSS